MTAKSKMAIKGDITVVERTTTITVGPNGTTTNVVETSSNKTPSAGDLELKKAELNSRRDVGVSQAQGNWLSRFWTPSPYGGFYGTTITSRGEGGYNYIYGN
jgi:hypothetical protein